MNTLSSRWFSQRDRGRRPGKSAILGVALAFLLLFAGKVQIVHAANITVTTTDDELNADGDCSLREAIEAANTNTAVDACPAGDPAPTVDIISFGVTGTITHQSGQVVITDDLTIHGPGASNLSLGTGGYGRVLAVPVGVTLNLSDLTLANSYGEVVGGVIYNEGTVTVTGTVFSGNSGGNGGAINNSPTGTLIITNTTFSQNLGQIGGAIRNEGMAAVTDTSFSGNFTSSSGQSGSGAGIFNLGTLTVTNAAFSGNFANVGAGIFNIGTLTITNANFSGNSAFSLGGGIFNGGTLTIYKSKITGNNAASGGGIFNDSGGTVTLTKSKVKGNLPDNCVGC